tara:strand:+ start:519 stop:734 length:216 start_codon:yes stop_codon:yes gene_type:complete
MGKIIIYLGCLLILLGFLIHYFGDYLKWFGNLPGDIKIVNKNLNIFIPFTSMILISILLTVIVNLFKKLLK